MALFPAIFQGIGNTVSNIFKTPLPGGTNVGGALLGAGIGLGIQQLQTALAPKAPRPQPQFVPQPQFQGQQQAFPPLGGQLPQGPRLSIGRDFGTPGDTSMAFIPGVSGSQFGPAVAALGGALLPTVLRGGGQILRNPVFQGAAGAIGAGALLDGGGDGGGSTPLFRATQAGARANSVVLAVNPVTGRPTFFRHVGTPMLFTGDLAIARKVTKVARRAARKR